MRVLLFYLDLLTCLSISGLENIFLNSNLFFGEEIELLQLIIGFYNKFKDDDNDIKNKINQLLLNINYNKINTAELCEREKSTLKEFPDIILIIEHSKIIKKRKSLMLKCKSEIRDTIMKLYMNNEIEVNSI